MKLLKGRENFIGQWQDWRCCTR